MNERMHVTTHFLQMHHVGEGRDVACPAETSVVRSHDLSPELYRRLYNDVGTRWLWYERSELNDKDLSQLIGDPAVSIYTLMHKGEVAGFTELRHTADEGIQILYFGLMPTHIGLGLGRYFLDWIVRTTFVDEPQRLWVHTCSLDHPSALTTYEQAGFTTYRRESGWVTIPAQALARREKS
ncbi:MAG: GNAT family N-acetyltransferase [Myxococcales bacterium]|nr:GNAT family N-acetyltransferase [Myxococcales bacterium]